MAPRLSERERRFVDAFMGPAKGNASKAATLAGYSAKASRQISSRLLTKANIQGAIAARAQKREAKTIADATERDTILSTIARQPDTDVHARIGAIKELNKCSGRHSIKHVLDVTEKVSDIIANSRAPR